MKRAEWMKVVSLGILLTGVSLAALSYANSKKENISELRAKMKEMIEAQYQIRYPYQTKTW